MKCLRSRITYARQSRINHARHSGLSGIRRFFFKTLLLLTFIGYPAGAFSASADPLAAPAMTPGMPTIPTMSGVPGIAGSSNITMPVVPGGDVSAASAEEAMPVNPATPSLTKPPKRTLSPEKAGRSGNWAKKRRWLKEALAVNEALQKDVSAAQRGRSKFYDAFNGIDNKVNEFYRTRGFTQGALEALIKDLHGDIAKEKERRIAHAKEKSEEDGIPLNYYDVQIEAIEEDAKKFEKEVAQFKLDVESIGQLDKSLNERLQVLDKHIKEVGGMGTQGQELTDDIWLMIDDKKARIAYYELKALGEKVTGTKGYIEGALLTDFKKVISTLSTHIMQVGDEVGKLERRGLVIEHRGERVKNKQTSFLSQRMHDEVGDDDEQDSEEVKPRRRRRRQPAPTLVDQILSPFKSVGALLMKPFQAVYDMFFGVTVPKVRIRKRKAEPVEAEPATEAEPTET